MNRRVFKITGRNGKKSDAYYGKVKTGSHWEKVKLFTNKEASEGELVKLQALADQRAAGLVSPERERLRLPLVELMGLYVESLKAQKRDADHIRIVEFMHKRLLELGRWKYFPDITQESVERVVSQLDSEGKTPSYRNKFIVRVKAFVHWALPAGCPDPLGKLRRVREKGGRKTRERRAATREEVNRLFALELPADRLLAYALAAFNGLRRNEISGPHGKNALRWGQVHLDSPIPFVELRQKAGEDDTPDSIPLHPYVVSLLSKRMQGMPETPILKAVPDIRTMEKDLNRAKVELADKRGARLDFHALRHTFATRLDQTGCSRATKKKLTRHANSDVTDGYTHADLSEMREALIRIPFPSIPQAEAGVKTGTDGVKIPVSEVCLNADHRSDQTSRPKRDLSRLTETLLPSDIIAGQKKQVCYSSLSDQNLRKVALAKMMQVLDLQELRPSTQVD